MLKGYITVSEIAKQWKVNPVSYTHLDVYKRQCLEYAYYAAVADAEKILLVEKWASEGQQQTHLRQPHMQQLKRWKEQYIAETAVEKI